MTRPGTRPGSNDSASSGVHPSASRSNSDNAISPSGTMHEEQDGDAAPSPEEGSYARRGASRPKRPRRRQAQSSSSYLLGRGDRNVRELSGRPPRVPTAAPPARTAAPAP